MSNSKDFQIMVGLGNSRLRKYFIKRKYIPRITQLCEAHKLGVTIMDAIGGYAAKDSYVVEYSLVIHISDVSEATVRTLAQEICKKLKQESVLFREVNAQTEFIS